MELDELLLCAVSRRASDLHLTIGAPPMLRIAGVLHPLTSSHLAMSAADTLRLADEVLTAAQRGRLLNAGEVDLGYSLPDIARFRVCVYRQRAGLSLAVRILALHPPSLRSLTLPEVIKNLVSQERGLLIVTGPTGSGKSTTLAALIDYLNHHSRKRVITLEDPIEYVHDHVQCLIDQREVGSDTTSFAQGLRAALRQDPDVLMIGELRDADTMTTALTAAETGHLVLATMHTADAVQAIDRLVDAFALGSQQQIRVQIASVLCAVVAQMLVPNVTGDEQVVAAEVLINTPAVANLLRTAKVQQLRTVMQTGRVYGMQTMEMGLRDLLQAGRISDMQYALYTARWAQTAGAVDDSVRGRGGV